MSALRSLIPQGGARLGLRRAHVSLVCRNGRTLLPQRPLQPVGTPRFISQTGFLRADATTNTSKEKVGSDEAKKSPGPEEVMAEEGEYVASRPIPINRLKQALTALLVFGVGITAWGVYNIYGFMTMWPKSIRKDLRSGLRAQYRGDFLLAAHYLTEAWEKAKSLPLSEFGPQPLLVTSGVAIALAAALEADRKPERAYKVLEDALNYIRTIHTGPLSSDQSETDTSSLKDLSPPEKMRAIALAYRLGEMAEELKLPAEEEEKYLSFAVQAILSSVMHAPSSSAAEVTQAASTGTEATSNVMYKDLHLPLRWINKQDLAAPFEALATFYSKHNKNSYALPLYLQAISILIPPPPTATSIEERCRAAQLMGNVADIILTRGTSEETIQQAESWAKKGLEVASAARGITNVKHQVCEIAYAVLLYNVALTRELSGDVPTAKKMFKQSLEHSKSIGLDEGIKYAETAIQKLDSGDGNIKPFFIPAPADTL